jgi:hypothetical protein
MLEVNKLRLCTPEPCICRCGIRQSHLRCGKWFVSVAWIATSHHHDGSQEAKGEVHHRHLVVKNLENKNKNNKWKIKFM